MSALHCSVLLCALPRHSFNRAVLACYVQLQDVRGVPLVESIRTFARSVTLMDSPCWVKSVMDEFARHYHTSNPRSFDSAGLFHAKMQTPEAHVFCKLLLVYCAMSSLCRDVWSSCIFSGYAESQSP